MSNLIQAADLIKLLGDETLRVVDTRFSLADPEAGEKAYREGHIPGAIFFDLDKDLSQAPGNHGGRHPLPAMTAFAQKLGQRGIGNEYQIVVYDDSSGMYAGRLWFMLSYAGHGAVRVLDGGIQAYLAAGGQLEPDLPSYLETQFALNLQEDKLVSKDYVLRNLENPDVLLVDARAAERYRGDVEPLDPKAGHIPGAMNLPFADNLRDGKYKSPEELKERFSDLEEAEEIIVYCGSGVSANHNFIALEEAGFKNIKLYGGSWSDWSSYQDNPIATGEE